MTDENDKFLRLQNYARVLTLQRNDALDRVAILEAELAFQRSRQVAVEAVVKGEDGTKGPP